MCACRRLAGTTAAALLFQQSFFFLSPFNLASPRCSAPGRPLPPLQDKEDQRGGTGANEPAFLPLLLYSLSLSVNQLLVADSSWRTCRQDDSSPASGLLLHRVEGWSTQKGEWKQPLNCHGAAVVLVLGSRVTWQQAQTPVYGSCMSAASLWGVSGRERRRMQHLGSRGDGGHDEFLVQIWFCSGLFRGEQCLTWMSLRGAVVSDGGGGGELQTDRPSLSSVSGASVARASEADRCLWGAAGKKSRELYDLLTDPHFHSRSLLSLVTSGKDKLVSRAQMWPSVKSELWLS